MKDTDKNLELLQEKPTALVYARVSSVSQDPNSQDYRCKQRAEEKGYPFEKAFLDKFTGGGDFWKRPAMRTLLEHIDTNQVSNPDKKYVVIFDDLKRFARDTEFHIRLRKEFKSRNVTVECLNFNFEDSPEGRFVETEQKASNTKTAS
jgi:DNA invertase Pin-like site-specific DNA recombinase